MKKILTLILAAIAAVTVIAGGCGVTERTDTLTAPVTEDNSRLVLGKEIKSSGIQLTSSSVPETSGVLTPEPSVVGSKVLTVTTENVDNPVIVWLVNYVDLQYASSMRMNANDYIKLTVSEDTLSAQVDCMGAFDSQIKITAALESDPSINAVCTCDYLKRTYGVLDFSIGVVDMKSTDGAVKRVETNYYIDSFGHTSNNISRVWDCSYENPFLLTTDTEMYFSIDFGTGTITPSPIIGVDSFSCFFVCPGTRVNVLVGSTLGSQGFGAGISGTFEIIFYTTTGEEMEFNVPVNIVSLEY